jgi:hypothetical protein
MSALPEFLLTHTMVVEPLLGRYSHGPQYGDPVTHRCFLDDGTSLVLSREGVEMVSSAKAYLQLNAEVPLDSRVTVNGQERTVIDVKRRDGKGLPTPDHLEVILK